jgi:hypothetical protein
MKKAQNCIIVSSENIEKTLDKLDSLNENEYEKLLMRFIKEQPGLLEFSAFIKEQYKKKFFDSFFDIMIVIWQSFEAAAGKVPEITEDIFEKMYDSPDNQFENIGELLNIKDEKKVQEKIDEFNRLISNIQSEDDMTKVKSKMGKDFDIIAGMAYKFVENIVQEELYSFIMEECLSSKISTAKKPQLEEMLAEELIFVMKCFDEAINSRPTMKVTKGGLYK